MTARSKTTPKIEPQAEPEDPEVAEMKEKLASLQAELTAIAGEKAHFSDKKERIPPDLMNQSWKTRRAIRALKRKLGIPITRTVGVKKDKEENSKEQVPEPPKKAPAKSTTKAPEPEPKAPAKAPEKKQTSKKATTEW